MSNSIDDGALLDLMEESQDLHSDAMRDGREKLGDYVEAANDAASDRSRGLGTGALVAGVAGAALLAGAAPARASGNDDIQILQTAASIENLAVTTYGVALGLKFIGGSAAIPVVKTFVTTTRKQHIDHAKGFNAAIVRLGGKEQHDPDPKYLAYVKSQEPKLTNPGAVVGLAIALEDVAAQTYTKDVSAVSTSTLRELFAGVAGVEAQHKAILLAVQALVKGGAANLIELPPPLAKLPAAAGSVGFPDSFYKTAMASPQAEGAVK